MAEYRSVDEAIKSVKSAEEYIRIGMEMCNEVALDFVENKKGTFFLKLSLKRRSTCPVKVCLRLAGPNCCVTNW